MMSATKELLRSCGQSFIEDEAFLTAGFSLWYAGYHTEFDELYRRNMRLIEEKNISMIVTNDPHEAYILREKYGVKVLHIVEFLSENLENIKKLPSIKVEYHHPCFLTKIGVEPKVSIRVLRRAGILLSQKQPAPRCCGSVGGDFARNNPATAEKVAKKRAGEFTEKIVVTCCPYCYAMLKQQKVKVKDITELLSEV